MRKKLIAGNWKMNKNYKDSQALADLINLELTEFDYENADVVLCPPFTSLSIVRDVLEDSSIDLGAQNLFYEDDGAYTGEISAGMLRSVGCSYVIIGHSERRQYFGETNEIINKKALKALGFELKPILCVGETLDERNSGKQDDVVGKQVRECIANLNVPDIENVTIAYEPVWAIGTGVNATPEQANEMHTFIRGILKEVYDEKTSSKVRILYGGSMKPSNSKELLSQSDIDGGLIGGASLEADSFVQIIRSI
ncbi:MAG: triose-phosphate isomerase [Ignavibacteriae bacterium]|nr:triose-phosphate isomerase [Ignavibacteriota bacterium]MCB9243022.1 triose-phosphate isomerase [Ignavibacteriales bacterium]